MNGIKSNTAIAALIKAMFATYLEKRININSISLTLVHKAISVELERHKICVTHTHKFSETIKS